MKKVKRKIDLSDCIYIPDALSTTISDAQQASNRVLPEDHKQFDPKNLRVSKGFQKHVAKHLESFLDDSTKFKTIEHDGKNAIKVKKLKNVKSNGVLLLSTSQNFLTDEVAKTNCADGKRKRRKVEVDEDLVLRRAKEVAVTPEYVLSMTDVKDWAPETRGKVELVKQRRF